MNPYLSWAILLVVAGGLGWYYTNGAAPKAKAPVQQILEKAQPVAKKPKRKTKAPEAASAKKPELKTVVSPPTTEDEQPEAEIDPREMARRQTAIKNGIPQTTTSKNKKKKQQKKAAQLDVGSHASSTTGAEADDDLSPAVSPQVNATVPSAGEIDDMLETPTSAANAKVLRVTGDLPAQPEKKNKKEPVAEKNKKARNHQRKNEERKEQARLDELDRQKKLEQHRRNIPEREAAWAQSHANNAWENKKATNGISKPAAAAPAPAAAPAANKVQLLDTFEPATTSEWEQGLPTEEVQEQMAKAADADQAWTQVKTKKGGNKKENKKANKTDESVSETSASEAKPAPVTSAPAPVKPRVTITPTYLPDLRSREKGHPLDSDWAA